MAPFKKVAENSWAVFPHLVGYREIIESKSTHNNLRERYCFGQTRANVTYYASTECLMIQGRSDLVESASASMEMLIAESFATVLMPKYSRPRHRPYEDATSETRSDPNMNGFATEVLSGLQTTIAQLETMNLYHSEIKTADELAIPTVCEKETQEEETEKRSSKSRIY